MKKFLKIGIMSTAHFRVPLPKGFVHPPLFVAQTIAKGLAGKGHKVYFFAPKGSKLEKVKIVSGGLESFYHLSQTKKGKKILGGEVQNEKMRNLWHQYLISLLFKVAKKERFDIIHLHPVERAMPLAFCHQEFPVVYTVHDPLSEWRKEIFRLFQTKNQYFVSISNAQRNPAPDLNWIATIYNGIDLKNFPFSREPKNYFLFVARIIPEKGLDVAVRITKKLKEKLLIIGPIEDKKYWNNKIKPYLGKDTKYLGCITHNLLYKYYQNAKALLVPLQWEEPFGLTMIEAMACGTPVIAFKRGSVPEVIKNGKTGFVVSPFIKNKKPNLDGFIKAIKKIDKIKREDCRNWVEKKFTVEKMVENYEKAFYKILSRDKAQQSAA